LCESLKHVQLSTDPLRAYVSHEVKRTRLCRWDSFRRKLQSRKNTSNLLRLSETVHIINAIKHWTTLVFVGYNMTHFYFYFFHTTRTSVFFFSIKIMLLLHSINLFTAPLKFKIMIIYLNISCAKSLANEARSPRFRYLNGHAIS